MRAALAALAALGAMAAMLLVLPQSAHAAGVYWKKADLLRSFFPGADKVTYRQFELDLRERASLAKRLGYMPKASYTIFYGLRKGSVQGYALIDEERGQHEPITFGVLMDPQGLVRRVEVLVYREHHGDQVRQRRFRRQFARKGARDRLRVGHEVVAISGATISSRSMAVGVKRALVLLDALVLGPKIHLAGSH